MKQAKVKYRCVAQLVARLLWEREAQVRAVALGKPGKPWESWADSTFPLAGNWSKIGVDHMFDHNWKISYPGVAQLVARLLWEQDAGSSSLPTRTTSEQALYRLLRLFYKSQSALTPLLILSKSQPLRWVVIWYRRFAAFFNFIEISVLTVLCRNPLKRNGFKGFLF